MQFWCIPTFSALLLSATAQAGVVTSVSIQDSSCHTAATNPGEYTSGSNLVCGTQNGSSNANLFHLDASGSRGATGTGFGYLTSSASFDYAILVTGTDQPGLLTVFFTWSQSMPIIGPNRLQWTTVTTQGISQPYYTGSGGPIVIPYTPGVPVHLYATVSGQAGSYDSNKPGDFSVSLDVSSITISDPGASWVIVPEPAGVASTLAGLVAMVMVHLRRGISRSR